MSSVEIINISKTFEDSRVVDDISVTISDGEFVSLLGPSGCGKTTTLRIIAGLIDPDEGAIKINGEDVVDQRPYQRNIGMVFQSYALFPHMTIGENIGFGLAMRKFPKHEISKKVAAALDLVRLPGLTDRYPKQLSGGQQQRVALARAIAIEPSVLLLDEPLSNLDLKLRMEMRVELMELHRRIGVTTLFVTHDQGEGLTLSDRVVVMNEGRIAQLGPPKQIYRRPANRFVAEFIGDTSIFEGTVEKADDKHVDLRTAGGASLKAVQPGGVNEGRKLTVSVRPESVTLTNAASVRGKREQVEGIVEHLAYSGPSTRCIIRLNDKETLQAEVFGAEFSIGDPVFASWNPDETNLLDE